jgi:high-affinity iron transporter
MFATALIVFRETLEAALIVGIVMAATRGAAGRGRWVGAGIVAGTAGAAAVAAFADAIATAVSGMGQELLNACVLFTAVTMLGWHNVWMKQHGRELAARISGIGRGVVEGSRPLYALAVVVGLALLREGSEVVLFLYGVVSSQRAGTLPMLAGGIIGLAGGTAAGFAMYRGLLRIPARHLFTVTAWMILLLAAGMAAQGARYLVQAGVLPPLGTALWNTSALLPEQSLPGQILHVLVGYMARPDGVQVLFYTVTLVLIGGLMKWSGRRTARPAAAQAAAIAVLVCGALTLGAPPEARANCKVYSPHVETAELELEARECLLQDSDPGESGIRTDTYEVGYGFTDWWSSTAVFEYTNEGEEGYHPAVRGWENIFQLTEPGRYWMDLGLYLEYEWAVAHDESDGVEAKILLEKSVGRWTNTANVIFERPVGGGAGDDVEVSYAWRTRYRWRPEIEPAIEAFGGVGNPGNFGFSGQSQTLGPVVLGKVGLNSRMALKYEAGYLFGLTSGSPNGTFKWLLELEARI